MKRRIYWSLCLISLAALLLSTAASLSLYYHFYEEQSQGDLRRQGEALSAGAMASGDAVEFLQNFTFSDKAVRITLLNRTVPYYLIPKQTPPPWKITLDARKYSRL